MDMTTQGDPARASRLKELRKKAGYDSARAAAASLGVAYSTYIAHENGSRGIPENAARQYARRFQTSFLELYYGEAAPGELVDAPVPGQIPVIAEIAAGAWVEAEQWHDVSDTIPFIPHPRFSQESQKALRVRGDSCDLIAADGAYVITVPLEMAIPHDGIEGLLREFKAKGRDLVVVVERMRGDFYEATLKALVQKPEGFQLEPRSSNPKWGKTIPFNEQMLLDGDDIRITRVMIGKYESTF